MGKCKLCLLDKPLIKKSHIIPDFMYQGLYDEKNRLNLFAPAELIEGTGRIDKPSSGEYEGDLLCNECDNEVIGKYESYASKALYGKVETSNDLPESANFITSGGVKYVKCRNFHYKEFKLFVLSMIWRASISSRPFFKEINLGEDEEVIRQMILSGDPKDFGFYPILILTWLADKSMPGDLIAQPGYNNNMYVFPIAGITYVVYKSIAEIPQGLKEFCLTENDEVSLLHLPEGKSLKLILTYSGVRI